MRKPDFTARLARKVCDVQRVRGLAVACVLLGATPAFAITDAEIERARNGALTSDFQEDIPGYQPQDGKTGKTGNNPWTDPDRREQVRRDDEPGRREARRIDTREYNHEDEDGGALGGLMNILLWGLLAVTFGLVLFWVVSEFAKSTDDAVLPAEEKQDAIAAATAAIIDKPLGDADELAARGEYAEAIHTLLLRTLHELARSAMVRVERSHTSREILARVPLLADAREALSVLITYVELTHFGDDPANADDYGKCREQFSRFASAFKAGLAIQQRVPQGGGTAVA